MADAPDTRVAILCGGLGSRLGDLTRDLPKPMIEIGGRPYLERVIESFAERSLRELILLTGFRHDLIEQHFGDGSRFGVAIAYSRESEPLGTGGALREARSLLGSRFLLTYGDVLRRFDYDRFVMRHRRDCVAVYPRLSVGNSDVDGDDLIVYDKRRPDLPFIDAGFAVLSSGVLDMLPADGPCSFEEVVYGGLADRRALECEVVDRNFFDIGTPDELRRTRAALERK